jgi:tryptophan synthase beta chain
MSTGKQRGPADAATPASRQEIGDTTRLVAGRDAGRLALGEASTHEILDVVVMTLNQFPERGDLWMMRFEIQRTLGLKADFIQAMREGYANPRFRRNIDWAAVQRMWEEIAPGEPPPADVILPRPTKPMPAAERAAVTRRFSDLALQIAGPELAQLSKDYQALRARPDFFTEFARGTRQALQRPTPLQRASALEQTYGSAARIFLKREDQRASTPELEMAVAQAHIAKMLGRHFILAGNDVDEFSLALARAAPAFGLKTTIVVGLLELDAKPEFIAELKKLGAAVEHYRGDDLKSHDPREGALRLWKHTCKTNHLAMSFGTGPNPYPRMVSDFQMLLGYECELQLRAHSGNGRPRALVAAVHSEADSIGFMLPYLKRSDVELFYAEPATVDGKKAWKSSARLRAYGGARREHAWLRATGRITHLPVTDDDARAAQEQLRQLEGVSVSLEDARAVALAAGLAKGAGDERDIVVLVA